VVDMERRLDSLPGDIVDIYHHLWANLTGDASKDLAADSALSQPGSGSRSMQ
jgi:hypothetical protein